MRNYLFASIVLFSFNSVAQTFSPDQLEQQRFNDRLSKIEKNLNILQKQFYKNGAPPKKSRLSENSENLSPRAEVRMDTLEEQMRNLTGRIEENQFVINNALKKINKIAEDIDFRLSQIEAAKKNAESKPIDTKPNTEQLPKESRLIGKLEKTTRESMAPLDTNGQYDRAFKYLRNAQYDKAEKSLREFIASNKGSELISNAYYWLGETYYVRENYEKSAVNFLKGYQDKPKGNKAADNLLKLGMSLNKLKKKKEACTTFNKLLKEFPKAESDIKSKVSEQKTNIKCS